MVLIQPFLIKLRGEDRCCESVNSMKWWYEVHQKQLDGVKYSKLLVLEGSHYLHHTQSQIMTSRIRDYMPTDYNSLHSMQSGLC